MSIRFKVILPYLLLTIIVAATGAYIVTRLVTSSLEERVSNYLLEAGRVVSDEMIRREQDHVAKGRVIAYTVGLSEALQTGNMEQVLELAEPAAGAQDIESLMVFDAQGLEVSHFIQQSNGTLMDVSQPGRHTDFPFVNNLLKENNPDSLPRRGLAVDPVDGRQYYFTAVVVEAEGQVAGVVVVGTSLNVILPELKNTSLADVIFYGSDRQVIASSIGMAQESLFRRTISLPDELYQSVLTGEGVVNGANIDADQRRYSIAYGPLQIGNDSLGVYAVVLPLDFVVASSEDSRDKYVWVYSLATIAVVLVGYLIARLIVNPLAKLVRVSLAITSGDLTRRAEIQSRDEIGILANTFDTMTESLQQRTLELEKSNRLLEQMDRTKTRFIQVAAHELRTPLTIVQGYAQMIEAQAKGKESDRFTRYADGILEGTTRMVEIIDNMLDVSRIDTNQLGVMPVSVQVDQEVEKVIETFQLALEVRKLSLETRGLDSLPAIQGDRDLLYKLFYHVIGNAIKFTPNGGRITVSGCVVDEPQEIEIAVRDSGIGVDPENQELVFEKFYQTGEVLLHSSGKTKFKGGGPGLGLAIARGIVKAHRGRIWLESPGYDEAKNPGTTVFIRLPVNGQFHENA